MKPATHRPRAAGFSLIELMVSMAIGLVVALAITIVMTRSESDKRVNGAVNDLDQTGAYLSFLLDRTVRNAGSGFAQSNSAVFGCRLDVKKTDGTTVLPLPTITDTNSAFRNVSSSTLPIRLAPVIIGRDVADTGGQTRGDVLMVMSGTSGFSEAARKVLVGSVSASQMLLSNTLGIATDDLILLSDPGVASGCKLQQVGTHSVSSTDQTLPLAGAYNAANGTLVNITAFGANTVALQLGNASTTTPNMPQFQLLGVAPNNTLASYDLLQYNASAPETTLADGVSEMHALYGLDTNTDGVIDQWVRPGVAGSGSFEPVTLFNNPALLRQVVAIRVGLILRSSLPERDAVIGPSNPTTHLGTVPLTLTLFNDLFPATPGVAYTRTYAAGTADLNYRYRTFELTIPLRNVMLSP